MLTLALGVFIFLFAIGLVHHHRESWRDRVSAGLKPESPEYRYFQQQMWRRGVASSLISAVGFLLIVYGLVMQYNPNRTVLLVLIALLLLLLIVILFLASWDFISIGRLYRLQREGLAKSKALLLEEAKLAKERMQNVNDTSPNQTKE